MSEWKKELVQNFRLYAVTDLKEVSSDILSKVDAAYEGGADIIQLRSKNLSDEELFEIGQSMKALAEKYQKLFFVNDRLDLALELEADGIHIGQDDVSVEEVRIAAKKANIDLLIGKSTHSLEQAISTAAEDVNYIGVGPIFGTPTKPDYVPVGTELIESVASQITKPFVVIGGINENNLEEVLSAGATRVAVVRAIFEAEDIYESTKRLREQIENSRGLCV